MNYSMSDSHILPRDSAFQYIGCLYMFCHLLHTYTIDALTNYLEIITATYMYTIE